jgi:hypothetical protein
MTVPKPIATITPAMDVQLVLVTPEMAKQWLSRRPHNRPISKMTVELYATDMKEGRWRLTHQGIGFNENDELIDGQHRLMAILTCGIPCWMFVTRGIASDATGPIDEGKRRNVRDAMSLRNKDVTPQEVAIVYAFLHSTSAWVFRKVSRSEVMDAMDNLAQPLDVICTALNLKTRRRRLVSPAAVGAAMLRCLLYDESYFEHLINFGDLLTGDPRSRYQLHEQTVQRFREALMSMNNGMKPKQHLIYGKTQSVLRGFLERRTLAHIYEAKEELFPLPLWDKGLM